MDEPPLETDEEAAALERARSDGESAAIDALIETHRPRLQQLIDARMDTALRGRCDPSDVVQEALLGASRRLPAYLDERADPERRAMPFFLWLRFLTAQKLVEIRRRELGAERRTALRDVPLRGRAFPDATSLDLAEALARSGATPSRAAAAGEHRALVSEALEQLSDTDREVLMLRHFEQLSNREIAHLLGLSDAGASLRHVRALGRLQAVLAEAGVEWSGVRE